MHDVIDSHAHVWDTSCTFVAGARYHPDYEATTETYLSILDAHSVGRAVLVQPSFLGTDNRYLLNSLRAHPDRLRGIVVLDPGATGAEMDDMAALGVIGLRYNLLSLAPRTLARPEYRTLTQRAADRGWWIEVQANGADWPFVLDTLGCDAPDGQTAGDVRVMVDHFGKPSAPDCPGFRRLIDRPPPRSCVKLSAPYRQTVPDPGILARAFLEAWGPERCLWGSDWPWTQHEGEHSYADALGWLERWTEGSDRSAIATHAPGLLGFD